MGMPFNALQGVGDFMEVWRFWLEETTILICVQPAILKYDVIISVQICDITFYMINIFVKTNKVVSSKLQPVLLEMNKTDLDTG